MPSENTGNVQVEVIPGLVSYFSWWSENLSVAIGANPYA